jgi:LytS/YehU family sensor histidine kinase
MMIPPLLLLPMVENAFKHGGNLALSGINIAVHLQVKGKEIHFTVYNRYSREPGDKPPGIGLPTLKERLDHYYPGKHTLTTMDNGMEYQVKLILF